MDKTIKKQKIIIIILSIITALLTISTISLLSIFLHQNLNKNEITATYLNLDIKQTENEEYNLDFYIKFTNQTNQNDYILRKDIYVAINDEEKTIVFLNEKEDVFILGEPSIQKNDNMILRLRITTKIKTQEYNKIILKYKNKEIINDNVYISKKRG